MKFCDKCGKTMEANAVFCLECGARNGDTQPMTPYNNSYNNWNPVKKKKKMSVWIIVLICLLIPVVAIFSLSFGLITIGILSSSSDTNTSEIGESRNQPSETKEKTENDQVLNNLFSDVISDINLRVDFIRACKQIELDAMKIKDFKQVDDWVSGTRYSFTYLDLPFRLYCNMDSTVNTIKLGKDMDLYKRGYEPYPISDYIVDSSVSSELQTKSKEYIKKQLNYPATANFPLLDWSIGRERNQYSVSSKVTAKNAFGVKEEIQFKLIYLVGDDTATMLYCELGGNILINNMDSAPSSERKRTETQGSASESNFEIVLEEGQLGTYGKTIEIDGYEYIKYHVPKGKYTIINNGKLCKVYLAKDKYFKNSDGYMENEIVKTISFTYYGETETIDIGSGEHLELSLNAIVTLIPKE